MIPDLYLLSIQQDLDYANVGPLTAYGVRYVIDQSELSAAF